MTFREISSKGETDSVFRDDIASYCPCARYRNMEIFQRCMEMRNPEFTQYADSYLSLLFTCARGAYEISSILIYLI